MKYFKDKNNKIYAFSADGSQDAFIPEGLVDITKAEADAIRFPAPTAEELAAVAKVAKLAALDSITVTTSSGKVFDGNETARLNLLSAITASAIVGQTSANWKLADNTVQTVTLDELKEALTLAIQRVGEIVTA
jgi:hypothetical protein